MKNRMGEINKRAWSLRKAIASFFNAPVKSFPWKPFFNQAKEEIMGGKTIKEIIETQYDVDTDGKIKLPGRDVRHNAHDRLSNTIIKGDYVTQKIDYPEKISESFIEALNKFEKFAKENGIKIVTTIQPKHGKRTTVESNACEEIEKFRKNARPRNGYVKFDTRKWDYKGDKGTWASWKDGVLTVKKAKSGTITDSYYNEISAYCTKYGIDFEGISCGQSVTV